MTNNLFSDFYIGALALFTLVLFTRCSGPGPTEPAEISPMANAGIQAIYDAADRRDIAELLPYAHAEKPAFRMAFAKGMASVQDSAALRELEGLLTDPIPYVRLYAAFATGQLGMESSLRALEGALKKATIPEIKAELLEAVGKCANAQAMDYLVHHDPNTAEEEIGKMYGIYRGTLKGLLLKDHLRTVEAHLSSTVPQTRLVALHILLRQGQFEVQPYCNALADRAVNDSEGEVRIAAMRAIQPCEGALDIAKVAAEADPDPRVRAMAVGLLPADGANPEIEKLLLRAMQDGSAWVAMAAADRFAALPNPELGPATVNLARRSEVPEVWAAIGAALLRFGHQQEFQALWDSAPPGIHRAVFLNALTDEPKADNLLLATTGWGPPEGTAATKAWIEGAKSLRERRSALDSLARAAFTGIQPAKAALFAAALRDTALADFFHLKDQWLRDALALYNGRPAYEETTGEIARTLAYRADSTYRRRPPRYNNAPPWQRIAEWPDTLKANVYAGGHRFVIELLTEEAPATVAYFTSLADSCWYDGTAFHRVVPAFVSQGGGPRGDGFGSTPNTIRSEFSMVRFTTGTVGMASAGKDTESCQFFITQAPAPHLDGRYTAFGKIVGGFSHLDEVATGTVIDSIRVVRE